MNELRGQRLTDTQIVTFQREARRTLVGKGYNLFAEITLRLIEHYYTYLAETENLRRMRGDRDMETEFLAAENDMLRARLAEVEQERNRLLSQTKQQEAEIDRLKRKKLNLPPSWKA